METIKNGKTKTIFSHIKDVEFETIEGKLTFKAGTLAIVPDGHGTYKVGFGLCSQQDEFNRRKGRLIAEGRAKKAIATYAEMGSPLYRHTLIIARDDNETILQTVDRAWQNVRTFVALTW